MPYEKIRYEVANEVASITLDDEATLNALSAAMGRELHDAISRAQTEARAILLGGNGRVFSSGANLGEGNFRLDDPDRDVGVNLEAVFNPLLLAMQACSIPIVAAIRGAVVGVGVGVACAADLIVMAESAFFHLPFCHLGLVPDAGSTYMLAEAVGRPRALEMMLLGERVGAAQAYAWGLVNRIVADSAIDGEAMAMARRLADGPRSVGLIRQLAWQGGAKTLRRHLDAERDGQCISGRTADFAQAVEAFRSRRKS